MQLSAAERQALGGAALVLLVQAIVPLHGALEYRQALVASQPWRALTAHLVHVNWVHALINLAAWFAVARLFAPELRTWRQPLVLAVAALAVTLHLALLHPGIAWYRGFSGTLHGVFFAGASAWLLALLADGERRPRALWLPAVLVTGGWSDRRAVAATMCTSGLTGSLAPRLERRYEWSSGFPSMCNS